MNITDKLERVQEVTRILMESGLQNMSVIAKSYKEATIYFHKDT